MPLEKTITVDEVRRRNEQSQAARKREKRNAPNAD